VPDRRVGVAETPGRNGRRRGRGAENRYDALSASLQPRTFQVFNTALSTANSLLGPWGSSRPPRVRASSGSWCSSRTTRLQKFIGWASTVAPQAIGLLGTDVTTLVHSVLTLAQAAAARACSELRLLTAGLQALDKVISVLPGPLEGAALGVGGLALALAKLGVLMPLLRLRGVAGALTAAKAAMAATAVEADAAAVRRRRWRARRSRRRLRRESWPRR